MNNFSLKIVPKLPDLGNDNLNEDFETVFNNVKELFEFNDCDRKVYDIIKYVFCHSMSIAFYYSDKNMVPKMKSFLNGEYEILINMRNALGDYFEGQIGIGKGKKDDK